MKEKLGIQVKSILSTYDPSTPQTTADALRALWLQFEPKSTSGIKAELRRKQETVGTPVPVLKTIGKAVGKEAKKRVDAFIPLTRLLWDDYGREGRVVGLIPLGLMELVDPEQIMPLLKEMCRTCITWEDADRLAMDALEPVVRKQPEQWLPSMEPWLVDDNKWVRRVAVIVVGRLPMKKPEFTARSLALINLCLFDEEVDVRKAVSFAIRLCARGDIIRVRDFLEQQVPPDSPAATWVLCDSIRSMTKSFLPDFTSLLPQYKAWANDAGLTARERSSIDSAIRTLRNSQA